MQEIVLKQGTTIIDSLGGTPYAAFLPHSPIQCWIDGQSEMFWSQFIFYSINIVRGWEGSGRGWEGGEKEVDW